MTFSISKPYFKLFLLVVLTVACYFLTVCNTLEVPQVDDQPVAFGFDNIKDDADDDAAADETIPGVQKTVFARPHSNLNAPPQMLLNVEIPQQFLSAVESLIKPDTYGRPPGADGAAPGNPLGALLPTTTKATVSPVLFDTNSAASWMCPSVLHTITWVCLTVGVHFLFLQ